MPLANKEARSEYIKNWKEANRRKLGKPKRKNLTQEDLDLREALRKEKRKEYTEKNRTKIVARQSEWRKNNLRAKPEIRLFYAAKKRSKEKNLPFNLDISDIVIPEYCPYLGLKLESFSQRGDPRMNVSSLDRIIPELGYVKGNVEVISHLANTMKSNANKDQLVKFAREVLIRFDSEDNGESSLL
jgi:hypothetical protein